MDTDFLRELILSGHEVFLLEDEETAGFGFGSGRGYISCDGYGRGNSAGYGERGGSGLGAGGSPCDGFGDSGGDGLGWGASDGGFADENIVGVNRKEEYGYRLPR